MTSLIIRFGIRPILWLLLVGSMAACALAWVGSVQFAEARLAQLIEREQAQAQAKAELASANLSQRLVQARSIASTLAQYQTIQAVLGRFGPHVQPSPLPLQERGDRWRADPVLQPLARGLAQTVEKFGLTMLWVTNAAGDTVMEGHIPDIHPFTGTNYADRAYFKAAQQGLDGHQFAVGRVSNLYGLFFSSPVLVDGQFVGIVGAGLAVSKLSPVIDIKELNAVVTDDLGVVVLAHDPALLMRTMPGATVGALPAGKRDLRYRRQQFEAVDLIPTAADGSPSRAQWHYLGRPHVMGNHPTSDGALRVYVLRDLGALLARSERDQLWWFGLVGAMVWLSAALAAGAAQYVITTQQQQIALQTLNQVLAHQANTDALTGCANRRHFMHALNQEFHRSSRYGVDFCVLSADIDHFKRVNDTYGHAAGDEVLRHFVATIQSHLRGTDLLGRLGGEEFSILLPQTSEDGGAMMAERLRAAVEASPALFGTTRIAITVSIGGVPSQAGSVHGVDAMLACADAALYAAKQGGRNRVVWVRQSPPENAEKESAG
ncbi:MAG: diguanylate cyclase [Hydrogenophaga sp.]|uniref:sensor domain-containing diguanylate cyclase n=1 Tax=Hydrogenophaga sp. TaxID=1904254 RepID=UPI0027288A21|nr:diguanylate cyclase [Hydrogenophaga sp.]MDO9481823.1 diguanylate cyclase [Hydrogenophaga sp.]MDP3343241.1 diguanylate cyclase [Hydrogenophaga sp.]MDP3808363.1 diguanylate cyclase [Hydrogenophaga sp.]